MVDSLTGTFRHLLSAYIRSRFEESHISLESFPFLEPEASGDVPSSELQVLVCRLGSDIQKNHADLFQAMVNELNPTRTTAYQQFVGVTGELFRGGVRWGKIVSLYVFCGELAVYCAKHENLIGYVRSVLEWAVRFFRVNIAGWMHEQGGWESFVEFFSDKKPPKDKDGDGAWRGVVAGLALGALAFGFLASK